MINIELPKDAEGREIPLDTVALYDDDGNVHSVRRFIYTPDFDLGDKWKRSWIAVVDNCKTAKPEQMHLTSPDTWEKLLDDLDRALSTPGPDTYASITCGYFDSANVNCSVCEYMHGIKNETCNDDAWRDIASRIRKLSGEDERRQ